MAYTIEITPRAEREFRKLPIQVRRALTGRIRGLSNDPRPQGSKQLESSRALWRVREGDYRVIYEIQESRLVVLVVRAGHRKDVYRQLARLLKSLPD